MNYAVKGRARVTAVALTLGLSLAACGGGGGGAGTMPAAPAAKGGAPASSASTQQQTATNSASQEVRAEQWAAKYAQPSYSAFRRIVHDHARRLQNVHILDASPSPSPSPSAAPTAVCNGASSDSVTQNADGSITIVHLGYYDETCSNLADSSSIAITAPDASGKMTGKGTETYYDTDGKTVTEADLLDILIYNANPGSGDLVMQIKRFGNATDAANPLALPLDTDYFSAVDAAPNTEKIGAASITQDPTFPGRQYGSNANFTTTYTGGLFGTNQTTKVTGSTVNSVDPGGALKIAVYPLAAGVSQWGINGGSILNTTSTTEISTQDSLGNMLSYTNTTTDSADDLTVTITGNPGGTQFTGIITQTSTGKQLAKFVVDQNGDGTITFADGTTRPVQNWCWGG